MLWSKPSPSEDLIVTGARVLDPVAGVDAVLDVRVDAGTIAALGQDLPRNGHRVVDGRAFVGHHAPFSSRNACRASSEAPMRFSSNVNPCSNR